MRQRGGEEWCVYDHFLYDLVEMATPSQQALPSTPKPVNSSQTAVSLTQHHYFLSLNLLGNLWKTQKTLLVP